MISTSFSLSPATLMEEVVSTPKRKSVDTLKMWANSTTYCVEGTEMPIFHALTLDLVIPSCLANSDCVLFWFSLRDFILSAIMLPPLSKSMLQQSKRYCIIIKIIQIDTKQKQSYN